MSGMLRNRLFAGSTNPMVVLEIGGNHEGDFAYATQLVELACQSKADAVKLQIYSADGLVNPQFDESRHHHFQKFELTVDQYRTLLHKIRASGKRSCASVWSDSLYRELADDIDLLKVGSGDLTNYLLTDMFLKSGKPVILSTGLASVEEVRAVVGRCKRTLGAGWASRVGLLQCTTSYPCPTEHTHLNVIGQYYEQFECSIGFSDHYEGSLASEVAFDIGAQIFEFHFTDSREGKTFRDHKISWTKDEVDAFIDRMPLVTAMMGSDSKTLTSFEAEQNYHREFRKGLYYARPLAKGDTIAVEDLISLRPAAQFDPSRYEELVGQVVIRSIEPLAAVRTEDLEDQG